MGGDGPGDLDVLREGFGAVDEDILAVVDLRSIVGAHLLEVLDRDGTPGLVGVVVRRFVGPGRSLDGQPAVSRSGVGATAAVQVVRHVPRTLQRPLVLGAPDVVAHHEDPHRRTLVDAVPHLLQPAVVPADDQAVVVERHVGAELELAHFDLVLARVAVVPGTENQPLPAPRQVGRALLAHAIEVADRSERAVVAVVPGGEIERGHRDLRIGLGHVREVPVRPVVGVLEPFVVPGGDVPEHREIVKRQVVLPLPFQAVPFRLRFLFGHGTAQPLALPHVGRDREEDPAHPVVVEAAAKVEEVTAGVEGHGRKDRHQVRRRLHGGQPLHGTRIRQAEGADTPVAPRLSRRPLDRVVAVLPLLVVRPELALRVVSPAHILRHDGIPGARRSDDRRLGPRLDEIVLAVRRAVHQRREPSRGRGPVDIGAQGHTVAHRDRHVLLDGHVGEIGAQDPCAGRLGLPGARAAPRQVRRTLGAAGERGRDGEHGTNGQTHAHSDEAVGRRAGTMRHGRRL